MYKNRASPTNYGAHCTRTNDSMPPATAVAEQFGSRAAYAITRNFRAAVSRWRCMLWIQISAALDAAWRNAIRRLTRPRRSLFRGNIIIRLQVCAGIRLRRIISYHLSFWTNPKRKKQRKRFGAGEWIRTTDLRITNAVLCQLSYSGSKFWPQIIREAPAMGQSINRRGCYVP